MTPIAFFFVPKRLLETTRRLGALGPEQARRILEIWREHPLACLKPHRMEHEQLAQLLADVCERRGLRPRSQAASVALVGPRAA